MQIPTTTKAVICHRITIFRTLRSRTISVQATYGLREPPPLHIPEMEIVYTPPPAIRTTLRCSWTTLPLTITLCSQTVLTLSLQAKRLCMHLQTLLEWHSITKLDDDVSIPSRQCGGNGDGSPDPACLTIVIIMLEISISLWFYRLSLLLSISYHTSFDQCTRSFLVWWPSGDCNWAVRIRKDTHWKHTCT